jgi:hypothetical protein
MSRPCIAGIDQPDAYREAGAVQVLPPDRPLQLPPAAMANGSILNVHPHEVRMDVNEAYSG